ncbi:MAG: Nramp family divalent metal transporter [Candidatus Brocadiia bacterium]
MPDGSVTTSHEPHAAPASAAVEILDGGSKRRGLGRLWPFLGPAFIASVAYVDPGNFATNLESGAKFGYLLVWAVIVCNLMAMLIQAMSAKLGIATGRNLAELCRDRYPRPVVWGMWGLMEVVAMATDLAEFLGAALGFHLLFGMPLWLGGVITGVATFLILGLERRGFRKLEAVITSLVAVIALCYLFELVLARPDWGAVAGSILSPSFSGTESVLLAAGILGATVMPHVIFLHSALMQGRVVAKSEEQKRRLFRFEVVDVVIAMAIAGAINAAMLIMAARTFHDTGMTNVDAIEVAHETLRTVLGPAAKHLFAISLIAAGLSSSAVGTMAGQVIMQGFLNFHIPVWVRRLVTMAPALVVIFIGFDPTKTLIMSQVVLSFGLPFAVIPLLQFTANRGLMGSLVNRRSTSFLAGLAVTLIIAMNVYLLIRTFGG